MTKDKYLTGIDTRLKPSLSQYGKLRKVPTVAIGLILDAIIPCTLGSITFLLKKIYGRTINFTIHNEVLN